MVPGRNLGRATLVRGRRSHHCGIPAFHNWLLFLILGSKVGVITFYNVKCLVMLYLKLSTSYLWIWEIYLPQNRREFLQWKFESLKGYACQFLVIKPFLTSDKHSRFSLSWPHCPSGRVMGQICVYRLYPCSFPHRINRIDMSFSRLIRNLRKKQNHLRFNSVHFKDKPRVDENDWCCWLAISTNQIWHNNE